MCVGPSESHSLPVRLRGPVIYHVSFSPGTLMTSVCRQSRPGFASSKVNALYSLEWSRELLYSRQLITTAAQAF